MMHRKKFWDDYGHTYESTIWREYKEDFFWGAGIVALFALMLCILL